MPLEQMLLTGKQLLSRQIHYIEAHRAAVGCLTNCIRWQSRKADIVVTSPGGFPKDLNIYQAQKALDNAKHAVRDAA